jgi:DNA-binding transcriptional LysR family regulator
MTIDNLKCFILVAENLSFARAAESLYISQPAVTKQINSLEAELETTLFIRSTRHVELTPAGMSFYKDAKEIVTKTQLAVQRLQSQNTEIGTLRIGVSNSAMLSYLSPVLRNFHKNYPEIYPDIEVLNHKIILNLFTEKKIDVLFYYKDNFTKTAGVSFKELKRDNFVCLTANDHPIAANKSVSICDLTKETIIVCNPLNAPIVESAFQQKILTQYNFSSVHYCNTIEIAQCIVSAKMGIAVLPSLLCPESKDFCKIPINNAKEIAFGVFYHNGSSQKSVEKFLQMIKS